MRFEVQGVEAVETSQAPYVRTFQVPELAEPGSTIIVKAIARDTSNNTALAEAAITIAVTPDSESPSLQLRGPATTAAGQVVRLIAAATDNNGIASVAFFVNGAEIASDPDLPYEASYLVPSDAQAGATLSVLARARDFAANAAESPVSITVVAPEQADSTPPQVELASPTQALPGATIALTATATDSGGVASVSFKVAGVTVGTDADAPYAASYILSPTLAPGTSVEVIAEAADFAGLTATASRNIVIGAPTQVQEAAVRGEVFDDTTGLPIADVTVALSGSSSAGIAYTQTTTTDARGRYVLRAGAGEGVVVIRKQGWTRVDRPVTLIGGQAIDALDARLTPFVAAARTIQAIAGGTLESAGAQLVIPAGALVQSTNLQITMVGQQGLQGRLPLGWSPIAAVDIVPHDVPLTGQATLRVPSALGVSAGVTLVAVRWDELSAAWRHVGAGRFAANGGLELDVAATGQYAWLVADAQPLAPPMPVIDALLAGGTRGVLLGEHRFWYLRKR